MSVAEDPRLAAAAAAMSHPVIFATVSGAHLYGFASADSDFDLRACHALPATAFAGLRAPDETLVVERKEPGFELDLVSHDVAKFARMMLRRNGYVLEQLLSPLVVRTSPFHDELVSLVPRCVTRHHGHHYLGFAATEWRLLERESPRRVKPLLYVYRVLLTGIRLLRTGEVEANLPRLNEEFRLPWIPDLIERKTSGTERGLLGDDDLAFHAEQRRRLEEELRAAAASSPLPDQPTAFHALDDLVLRARAAA